MSETCLGFTIIITCIISSFLNDVNISVNEVKTLFDIDKVESKYMLFDLNDMSQINDRITCPNEEINTTETEEEISEPENNYDTQNENEEENQSRDKDDTQNENEEENKSVSNKEEDSGKIIQLNGYLFMFILFVFEIIYIFIFFLINK